MIDDGLEHNPGISRRALVALHDSAFGWALSVTAYDPQAAEDVLQQAYLALVEGKARYDGSATLKTWLFAVIRNVARRHARRRRVELRALSWLGGMRALHSSRSAEALSEESDGALRAALFALPARQREVLELVIDAEFTLEQAATVLGISVGSARTHYHRAKRKLRAVLENGNER